METFTTPQGRRIRVIGDPALLDATRRPVIAARFDTDPRIASVSIMAAPGHTGTFLRATSPAGCVVATATDTDTLAGAASEPNLRAWSLRASDRGLWHDWWLTDSADVSRARLLLPADRMDTEEALDPSSAHHAMRVDRRPHRDGLSITVDISWLGSFQTGAQVHITEAIGALARHPRVACIVLAGAPALPRYARHLGDADRVTLAAPTGPAALTDILWLPNQVIDRRSAYFARPRGRRIVMSYLDFISYDIPRYHRSQRAWRAFRHLQRHTILTVDGIAAISNDVASRLFAEVPYLDPARTTTVPLGMDHLLDANAPEHPPAEIADLANRLHGRQFLAVLGTDYHHKNRDFAIAVWKRVLQSAHPCDLVLAGLHIRRRSSRKNEAPLLDRGEPGGTAHIVGHLSEDSRDWLLSNATAVLYPTSAEGFGLVPYEAAGVGTPSTFTHFGPLSEMTPVTDLPGTWDVEAHANDVTRLLADPAAATGRIAALRSVASRHTWDDFATQLVAFFLEVTAMLPAPGRLVNTSATGASSRRSWRHATGVGRPHAVTRLWHQVRERLG